MKRTYTFVKKVGSLRYELSTGQEIDIPLFPGILKHLSVGDLTKSLNTPPALLKYTREALKSAPWPVLKEFPRSWLISCMDRAEIREGRRRALEFLLF
jgi:hypothetical protein